MRKSLTFNGIRKPWLYLLEGREKSPFAPIRNNVVRVTGMSGAYVVSKETDVLYIRQPIGFIVKNDEHALQLKDELAEWLITDRAVPLQFDDEPGRTYYAEIEGTIEDFQKFVDQRKGILTFLCVDPYSYGPEKVYQTDQDTFIVENEGTAEAEPIFELTAKEPVTFAMISDGERYNMIGRPADVDEQVIEERSLVLHENGETLSSWQPAPGFTGSFTGSENGIFVQSYGTGTGWHGPGLMKEIDPIQDFEIEFLVNARTNKYDQTFRISTNYFDENMNELGLLRLWDNSAYRNHKAVETRVGPYVGQHINYPISSRNYNMLGQLVWYGLIRVIRKGNVFTFYVARIDQRGRHVDTLSQTFIDVNNQFTGRLKFIRFDIAKYAGTATATEVSIDRIRVFKHNEIVEDQTPYIADVGDIFTFDHSTNELLLNGEDVKSMKDFGGEYFDLPKGFTTLTVLPEGAFDTTVRFRPRYR